MLGVSPLIAGSSLLAGSLTDLLRAEAPKKERFLGWLGNLQEHSDSVISSPDQALDVMDFEPAARNAIPPAHWGYLSTGVDDDATVRANREGYSHIQIRSRRLVDVMKIDMSRTIFWREVGHSDRALARERTESVSYRRRAGGGSGGKNQGPLDDALHRCHGFHRRRYCRPWRARVAAALSDECLGNHTRHCQARRNRGIVRDCPDRRSARRQ